MAIVFNSKNYTTVLSAKTKNEGYINQLYSSFESMTFVEKANAIQAIDYLKTLNYEYEKYIILYKQQTKPSEKKGTYVILEGDTLVSIANKIYGDPYRWSDIFNYNDLSDIKLVVGDVLNMPEV